MKRVFIIVSLCLTSNIALAQSPTASKSERDLKDLLRRLVPEESEEVVPASTSVTTTSKVQKTNAENKGETKQAAQNTSSKQVAFTTIPFAFGLLFAFALFSYANRRKPRGERPLRRIAVEPLGSKQNLMLVEALGEYLLVATGGREPVLLAQLDTEQAKCRLAALKTNENPEKETRTNPWNQIVKRALNALSPNRARTFKDILDEAPMNIHSSTQNTKKNEQPAAKLALAQASLRALDTDPPPRKKSLNERLAEIAEEEEPLPTSRVDRTDVIRRRLASL